MGRRAPYSASLVQAVCLLTLMASGDDFNLVRMVLPGTLGQPLTSHTPLDDENTDFLEAAGWSKPEGKQLNRSGVAFGPDGPQAAALPTLPKSPPRFCSAIRPRNTSLARTSTPLRC